MWPAAARSAGSARHLGGRILGIVVLTQFVGGVAAVVPFSRVVRRV